MIFRAILVQANELGILIGLSVSNARELRSLLADIVRKRAKRLSGMKVQEEFAGNPVREEYNKFLNDCWKSLPLMHNFVGQERHYQAHNGGNYDSILTALATTISRVLFENRESVHLDSSPGEKEVLLVPNVRGKYHSLLHLLIKHDENDMLDIMNDIRVKHYNSNWYCGTGKKRKRLNIDARGYSYRYNSLFLSFELLLADFASLFLFRSFGDDEDDEMMSNNNSSGDHSSSGGSVSLRENTGRDPMINSQLSSSYYLSNK
jgi:hypothetical protein